MGVVIQTEKAMRVRNMYNLSVIEIGRKGISYIII